MSTQISTQNTMLGDVQVCRKTQVHQAADHWAEPLMFHPLQGVAMAGWFLAASCLLGKMNTVP